MLFPVHKCHNLKRECRSYIKCRWLWRFFKLHTYVETHKQYEKRIMLLEHSVEGEDRGYPAVDQYHERN